MKNLMMLVATVLIATSPTGYGAAEKSSHLYNCPDCGCAADTRTFDKPGKCPACGMALVEKSSAKEGRPSVAVLLFDHAEVIDYAGPWEVFGEAGYKVFTVAESTAPVNATFGQKIVPDYTFANSPTPEVLLVPGGGVGKAVANRKLIEWVQATAQKSKHVMSVCTGAFILSKAGLLDGSSATTIQHAIDDLQKVSPKTKVVHDQRYVDNGKVITTAGLSSGIDGAFHLLAKMRGEGTAQAVALGMEYRWDPHSTYARAALADRFFPDFLEATGVEATVISTQGDVDHWEIKALFSEPKSVDEIADLLNKRITSNTPHAKGPVTLAHSGANNSATNWNFKDDEGSIWTGEERIEPAPDQHDEFIVTLKLRRRGDDEST